MTLCLLAITVNTETATKVAIKKNMVYISESPKVRTAEFTVETAKPTISEVDAIISEVDATKETKSTEQEKAQLKKLTKKFAEEYQTKQVLVTEADQLKKNYIKTSTEAEFYGKQVISMKELLKKYSKLVKSQKSSASVKEYTAKAGEIAEKLKVIQRQKQISESLSNKAKLEIEAKKLEIEKIASKIQKRTDEDPTFVAESKRSQAENQAKIITEKLKAHEVEVATLKNQVKVVENKLKVETSPIVRKELKEKLEVGKDQVIQMEIKSRQLKADLKQQKETVSKTTSGLKMLRKQAEKQELKNAIRGVCTAFKVRAFKKKCATKNAKGVCTKYDTLYRTQKCLKYNGDACLKYEFTYSKKNSRYECVSRSLNYKAERCDKYDATNPGCLHKKEVYGVKACLQRATNKGAVVCVEKKVVFPRYYCAKVHGSKCLEVTYLRPTFYCQEYAKLPDQDDRYCAKSDSYFGNDHYKFECVQDSKMGCMKFKKEKIPGSTKLHQMSKTWLKENVKTLLKTPIKKTILRQTEKRGAKKQIQKNGKISTVTGKKHSDKKVKKVVDEFKAKLKEKLRAIRLSKAITKAAQKTAEKLRKSKAAKLNKKGVNTEHTGKVSTQNKDLKTDAKGNLIKKGVATTNTEQQEQKLTAEQKKELQAYEQQTLEKLEAGRALIKQAAKVIVAQKKKLVVKDQKTVEEAEKIILKQNAQIIKTAEKRFVLAEKVLKKWRTGTVRRHIEKMVREHVSLLEKAQEVIFQSEKKILALKYLKTETKSMVVKKRCQRRIVAFEVQKKAATVLKAKALVSMKKVTTLIINRLGPQEGKRIAKTFVTYTKNAPKIIKANKKIIAAKKDIHKGKEKKDKLKKKIGKIQKLIGKVTKPVVTITKPKTTHTPSKTQKTDKVTKTTTPAKKGKDTVTHTKGTKGKTTHTPAKTIKVDTGKGGAVTHKTPSKTTTTKGTKGTKGKNTHTPSTSKTVVTPKKKGKDTVTHTNHHTPGKAIHVHINVNKLTKKVKDKVTALSKKLIAAKIAYDKVNKQIYAQQEIILSSQKERLHFSAGALVTMERATEVKTQQKEVIKATEYKMKQTAEKVAVFKALNVHFQSKTLNQLIGLEQVHLKDCAKKIELAQKVIITTEAVIIKKGSLKVSKRQADKVLIKLTAEQKDKLAKLVLINKKIDEARKKLQVEKDKKRQELIKKFITESQKTKVETAKAITELKKAKVEIETAKHDRKVIEHKKSIRRRVAAKITYSEGPTISKTADKAARVEYSWKATRKNYKLIYKTAKAKAVVKKYKLRIRKQRLVANKHALIRKKYTRMLKRKVQIIKQDRVLIKQLKDRIKKIQVKKIAYRKLIAKGGKKLVRVKIAARKRKIKEIKLRIKRITKNIVYYKKKVLVYKRVLKKEKKIGRKAIKDIFHYKAKMIKYQKPKGAKKTIMEINKHFKKKMVKATDFIKHKQKWIKKYKKWIKNMEKQLKTGKLTKERKVIFETRIKKLRKRIVYLEKRITTLKKRIYLRKKKIIRFKRLAIRLEPYHTKAVKDVIKLNKVYKNKIHYKMVQIKKGRWVIRKAKRTIKVLQNQIKVYKHKKVKVTPKLIKEIKHKIKVLEKKIKMATKKIIKYKRKVKYYKKVIIKNKLIIHKRKRVALPTIIVKKVDMIKILQTEDTKIVTKINEVMGKIQDVQIVRRKCSSNTCVQKAEKILKGYTVELAHLRRRLKENDKNREELEEVIKTLKRIRLIFTYYKKHPTCSASQNWKAYRVVRAQRLRIIKKATKSIVSMRELNTKESAKVARVWQEVVRKEVRSIQVDKMRVENVIESCRRLRSFRRFNKYYKKLIHYKVTTTCNKKRINKVLTAILGYRTTKIARITQKIETESKKMSATKSQSKKSDIQVVINLQRDIIQKERVQMIKDQKRIMEVFSHCKNIKKNSLKVMSKKSGATCNPIALRNRIHNIVNNVIVKISVAKKKILALEKKLKSAKTEKAKAKIRAEIKLHRKVIKVKTQKVQKDRKNVEKIIKVCKKYGLIVKNIPALKKHYKNIAKIRRMRKQYWKTWLKLVRKKDSYYVYRKLITTNPQVTCNRVRITGFTAFIIKFRHRLIRRAEQKIKRDRKLIKTTKDKKIKAKLEVLIKKIEKKIVDQRRFLMNDKRRIMNVINYCIRVTEYAKRMNDYLYIKQISFTSRFSKQYKWVKKVYINDKLIRKARDAYYKSWTKLIRSRKSGSLIYRRIIKMNPGVTCNKGRIQRITKSVKSLRKRIIHKLEKKIETQQKIVKKASTDAKGMKKAEAKIKKEKRHIKRQKKYMRLDKLKITSIVHKCKVIRVQHKTLTRYIKMRKLLLVHRDGKLYTMSQKIHVNKKMIELAKEKFVRSWQTLRTLRSSGSLLLRRIVRRSFKATCNSQHVTKATESVVKYRTDVYNKAVTQVNKLREIRSKTEDKTEVKLLSKKIEAHERVMETQKRRIANDKKNARKVIKLCVKVGKFREVLHKYVVMRREMLVKRNGRMFMYSTHAKVQHRREMKQHEEMKKLYSVHVRARAAKSHKKKTQKANKGKKSQKKAQRSEKDNKNLKKQKKAQKKTEEKKNDNKNKRK